MEKFSAGGEKIPGKTRTSLSTNKIEKLNRTFNKAVTAASQHAPSKTNNKDDAAANDDIQSLKSALSRPKSTKSLVYSRTSRAQKNIDRQSQQQSKASVRPMSAHRNDTTSRFCEN